MKLFRKRRKGNNKGFSLVELVCAIAIFGIVLTAIGSAMVVSAQSYSKGTYEIDVQKEAQTTTNLIGNLIVDAVTAEMSYSDAGQKVLTIQNDIKKYVITFDDDAGILNYYEQNRETMAEATGVLAQNVKDFDVNLDDFADFSNAEVYLKVEKNNRAYEATYNTTSRNGSAESVDLADDVKIIVENYVVLEPNQEYQIPITVVGSVSNKAISVTGLTAVTGELKDTQFDYSAANSAATIKIGNDAHGSFAFNISTIMTDEETGQPLATEQVVIHVRRVNAITSPSAGDDGYVNDSAFLQNESAAGVDKLDAGAVYKVDFVPQVNKPNKEFGKAFDMDYVDPRPLNISMSMNEGYTLNDYVEVINVVYTSTDTSNSYAKIRLKQDLPQGAVINIKASSRHAVAGENKTLRAYDQNAELTVKIGNKQSAFSLSSDVNRGNDGQGVYIICNDMANLISLYGNNFKRFVKVYEAELENNEYVKTSFAFEVPTGEGGGSGDNGQIPIRKVDSDRLKPDQAYIINCRIEFYDDNGNKIWPTAETDSSLYSTEFPIPAMSVEYDCAPMGVLGNEYPITTDRMYRLEYTCVGLDLTQYQNNITWVVEKSDGYGNFDPYYGNFEVGSEMKDQISSLKGEGKIKIWMRETGTYRFLARVSNYKYLNYDGSSTTSNCALNDGETVGVLYVKVVQ